MLKYYYETIVVGIFLGVLGSALFAIFGPHDIAGYFILFVYPFYAICVGCMFRSPISGAKVGIVPILTHISVIVVYLTSKIFVDMSFYMLPNLIIDTFLGLIVFGGFSALIGYISGKLCPQKVFIKFFNIIKEKEYIKNSFKNLEEADYRKVPVKYNFLSYFFNNFKSDYLLKLYLFVFSISAIFGSIVGIVTPNLVRLLGGFILILLIIFTIYNGIIFKLSYELQSFCVDEDISLSEFILVWIAAFGFLFNIISIPLSIPILFRLVWLLLIFAFLFTIYYYCLIKTKNTKLATLVLFTALYGCSAGLSASLLGLNILFYNLILFLIGIFLYLFIKKHEMKTRIY